jgi:hypothetical protein
VIAGNTHSSIVGLKLPTNRRSGFCAADEELTGGAEDGPAIGDELEGGAAADER